MSFFLIKAPKCRNTLKLAKIRFEDGLNLKRLPLEEYMSIEEASLIYPKKNLFSHLVKNADFHGFQLVGSEEIYIYPQLFYKFIQTFYKNKLIETINNFPLPKNYETFH